MDRPTINFFSSYTQQKAVNQLTESIYNHINFIVVTGEAGTGKTFIMHRVLATFATGCSPMLFHYAPGGLDDFLDYILERFELSDGTSPRKNNPQQKMAVIAEHLHQQHRPGQFNAIIIDDAQSLSQSLLVSILPLVFPPRAQRSLLQLVLVGSPRLARLLEKPSIQELLPQSQRYICVDPLTPEETAAFIARRQERPEHFSAEAIAKIITYAHGIPRLISMLCGNASFAARSESAKVVTEHFVDEALDSCELALGLDPEQRASNVGVGHLARGASALRVTDDRSRMDRQTDELISSSPTQEQPMYRTENINKVLKTLQSGSPDVEAAALISEDGLMIASALPQDLDETRVAGMSATLLSLGTRAAVELGRGEVQEVVVRGIHGYSVLVNAGRGVLLLVIANENAKLGLIFFDMREAANALRQIL